MFSCMVNIPHSTRDRLRQVWKLVPLFMSIFALLDGWQWWVGSLISLSNWTWNSTPIHKHYKFRYFGIHIYFVKKQVICPDIFVEVIWSNLFALSSPALLTWTQSMRVIFETFETFQLFGKAYERIRGTTKGWQFLLWFLRHSYKI